MTAMPEARLAREAELPYAVLGMVTDYDSWRDGEAGVEADAILAVMRANAALARKAMGALAELLPSDRTAVPIDTTLDTAIVTPRSHWGPPARSRLDAILRRIGAAQ